MVAKAYVLVTAMPPTKGHLRLIQFASCLADRVEVIVCTQPGEPFIHERFESLDEAVNKRMWWTKSRVHMNRIHKQLPQEPEGREGFWDMWTGFLQQYGFEAGDYIVASERYGKPLAEHAGGVFMPYDIDRQLYGSKATMVRQFPLTFFDKILPEFQPFMRKTVTIFGAESTGKTTLSQNIAKFNNWHWLYEYARPFLENTSIDITEEVMTRIWKGQKAAQMHAHLYWQDKPIIVQDTDLYSTVGYWDMSPWGGMGRAPEQLRFDAKMYKSDLYVITRSNIPFEHDPLRYGGDSREISDEQWIDFADRNGLNYIVLDSADLNQRGEQAESAIADLFFKENAAIMDYQREGQEYR